MEQIIVNNPRILLVNLPTLPLEHLKTCFTGKGQTPHTLAMPMGLLYLSAYLQKQCEVAAVELLDYNANLPNIALHQDLDSFIISEAKNQVSVPPDIVGISFIFTASHAFFEVAVAALRALWPNALIIVGGTHATNCGKILLENRNFDYLVRGEGEIPLVRIVEQYKNGQPIQVRGVYASGEPSSLIPTKEMVLGEALTDLDDLPFPDWNLLQMEKYITSVGRRRSLGKAEFKRLATILTSRGCPFKCTYCSAHTVHGRSVRFRSLDLVVEEVRLLHEKFGVDLIVPEDDLFTAKKDRTLELLKKLRELNIPEFEVQFPSGLSINQLDGDMLDEMVLCGVQAINLALESGSEYVQEYIIKKNANLQKAKELVALCRNKGIVARCFVIFGFPGETKELMNETVQYLKELKCDWCTCMIATPLIGSEMYEQFLAEGYIHEDMEVLSHNIFRDRNFDTKEITAADLKEFLYRVNLDVNFVNNPNLELGNYDLAIAMYNDILCTYPFHIFAWYGIYLANQGKHDQKNAEKARQQIITLVKTNQQSQEMYCKYRELFPQDIVSDFGE